MKGTDMNMIVYLMFGDRIPYLEVIGVIPVECTDSLDIGSAAVNECNWIIPDFVRPMHYSIFEDE